MAGKVGLKVCQVCAVDWTVHHLLSPLIDGMSQAGWEVSALCSDGPLVPDLRSRGYRIHTIHIARSLNLLAHLRSVVDAVRLFKRERYDVVHVHTPTAALIGRLAARLARVPLIVYTSHGFYFHDEMPSLKRRAFILAEQIGGICTDLMFAQSAEDARTAVETGIIRGKEVIAIGNGVDTNRFDPEIVGNQRGLRHQLGVPDHAFLIGMIGRQVREKGLAELLEAAAQLAEHHPQAWFLLIGERLPSDHAAGIENELAQARAALGERLIVTGPRADIPELLAAMDLFCLPSWREGMPRTIIEAMMMAKPVVATNIRGAREEVVPEETGLLVPTRSPKSLAAAISRCLAAPEWAQGLGVNGRRRALRLYNEQDVIACQIQHITTHAQRRGLLRKVHA